MSPEEKFLLLDIDIICWEICEKYEKLKCHMFVLAGFFNKRMKKRCPIWKNSRKKVSNKYLIKL